MPPAARITDLHVCPKVEPGPVPHVGLPVSSGEPSVLIGYQPAARVGDMAPCVPAIDKIKQGASNVIIGNKDAARMGDPTDHGGVVASGCLTVIIGTSSQSVTLTAAATTGAPFCEECEKARKAEEEKRAAKAS